MRFSHHSRYSRLLFCLVAAFVVTAFLIRPSWARSYGQPKKIQPQIFDEEDVERSLKRYIGIPYELGGFTNNGLDCSGFVRHAFKRIFGVDLPHNSKEQSSFPSLKKITAGGLKTGDLLFFSQSPRSKSVSHVGIYLSGGRFIHSQGKKGVIISKLDASYWMPRLKAAKRLNGIEIRPKGLSTEMATSSWHLSLSDRSDLALDLTILKMPQVASPDQVLSALPTWASKSGGVWQPLLQSFQAAYAFDTVLWGLEIAAFRDELPFNIPWHIQRNEPLMAFHSMDFSQHTYRREGFRLGGKFLTDEGMTLRPSVGFLHYMDLPGGNDIARRTLDLGIELASESSGWSLAADLFYSDKRRGLDYLFDSENNMISVDMSLTLRHQLNDRVGFSVTGKRSMNEFVESEDAKGFPGTGQKSLYFKLDFRY